MDGSNFGPGGPGGKAFGPGERWAGASFWRDRLVAEPVVEPVIEREWGLSAWQVAEVVLAIVVASELIGMLP